MKKNIKERVMSLVLLILAFFVVAVIAILIVNFATERMEEDYFKENSNGYLFEKKAAKWLKKKQLMKEPLCVMSDELMAQSMKTWVGPEIDAYMKNHKKKKVRRIVFCIESKNEKGIVVGIDNRGKVIE